MLITVSVKFITDKPDLTLQCTDWYIYEGAYQFLNNPNNLLNPRPIISVPQSSALYVQELN